MERENNFFLRREKKEIVAYRPSVEHVPPLPPRIRIRDARPLSRNFKLYPRRVRVHKRYLQYSRPFR